MMRKLKRMRKMKVCHDDYDRRYFAGEAIAQGNYLFLSVNNMTFEAAFFAEYASQLRNRVASITFTSGPNDHYAMNQDIAARIAAAVGCDETNLTFIEHVDAMRLDHYFKVGQFDNIYFQAPWCNSGANRISKAEAAQFTANLVLGLMTSSSAILNAGGLLFIGLQRDPYYRPRYQLEAAEAAGGQAHLIYESSAPDTLYVSLYRRGYRHESYNRMNVGNNWEGRYYRKQ